MKNENVVKYHIVDVMILEDIPFYAYEMNCLFTMLCNYNNILNHFRINQYVRCMAITLCIRYALFDPYYVCIYIKVCVQK